MCRCPKTHLSIYAARVAGKLSCLRGRGKALMEGSRRYHNLIQKYTSRLVFRLLVLETPRYLHPRRLLLWNALSDSRL